MDNLVYLRSFPKIEYSSLNHKLDALQISNLALKLIAEDPFSI